MIQNEVQIGENNMKRTFLGDTPVPSIKTIREHFVTELCHSYLIPDLNHSLGSFMSMIPIMNEKIG